MGRTSELYRLLLGKELFGDNFKGDLPYTANFVNVPPEKMKEAIEEVIKKLDGVYSNKKKIKRKFKEMCDEKKEESDEYRNTAHDKESKKRYGEGIKFEQYRKNRDQLINKMAEDIERDIAWNNALMNLGINAEQANNIASGNERWPKLLMRTGNDLASKAHNLKIVSLLACGKGLITEETFKKVRIEQCTKYEGKSNEKATEIVNNEFAHIGDSLWNEIMKKIEPEMRSSDDTGKYVNDILTGKAGKKGSPSLEKCYNGIGSADAVLYWDLQLVVDNINTLPGFSDYNTKRKFALEQQEKAQIDSSLQEYADFAANPFFCVVDPIKTIDLSKEGKGFLPHVPADREPTLEENLITAFNGNCIGIYSNKGGQENRLLSPFGLSADEKVVYEDKGKRVFRDDYGNTCILRYQEMGDRGPLYVDAFHPEDLVNTGLEKEMGEFLHTCKSWSREKHTSEQFENMRKALENLADGGKLLYAPDSNDINPMRARISALLKTSEIYLKKKKDENSFFRSSYEKRRIALANKLKKFATRKLEELQYVEEHMNTLEKSKKEEKKLEKNKDYIESKKNPKLKNMTPLQYLKYVEQQKREAEALKKAAQEAEEKRKRNEKAEKIENAQRLEEGKVILENIKNIHSGIKENSSDKNNAIKIVEDYLKIEKSEYKPLKDGRDKNKNLTEKFVLTEDDKKKGKRIFAGNVINAMLEFENTPELNKDNDFTIHEIVNGGKISDLVDLIVNYSKFKDNFDKNIPNTVRNMSYVIGCDSILASGSLKPNSFKVVREFKADIKLAMEDAKERINENLEPEVMAENAENNIINENEIVEEDQKVEEKVDNERSNNFTEDIKKSEERIDEKSEAKIEKINLKELKKIQENEIKVKKKGEEKVDIKKEQREQVENKNLLRDKRKDAKRERISLNINSKQDKMKKEKISRTMTFSNPHSNVINSTERKK